jgi:hypothetical protein
MLRVLAAGQQIYNSLPNVGLKSQLLLNLNSFIMMLERQKRLTFVDLMSQTLSSIDPSNLEHLESICDMAISMLERSRLMNFTIYIHDETLENQLRRVVEQCLHAHQDLISTLATKSSAKIDPSTRDRLVMVCLLAKIKFNIGSPVINHMGRLLKTMNDLTFAWCFSAFQTRDHLQCLLHELKLRLKDSSCFSLHLVNTIIGSFYFRSMAGVLMLNPEKRKIITDSTYVKDLTFEQLLALPTIQNPKFLEESEMLLVFLPNLMACIEKYFLGIVQQNKFKIVRASYADSFLAKDIFSPNDYRNQRWAFAMLTPNRFFVSVEEISVFFRLCSQLNYNSLGLWLAFEKILIQMLESELVVAKEKNNGGIVISLGILGNLTKVCNSQKVRSTKVWELIEKVDDSSTLVCCPDA